MFRKTESRSKFYISAEIPRPNVEVAKPTHLPIRSEEAVITELRQPQPLLTPQELPSHIPGEIFGGTKEKRRCLLRYFRNKVSNNEQN